MIGESFKESENFLYCSSLCSKTPFHSFEDLQHGCHVNLSFKSDRDGYQWKKLSQSVFLLLFSFWVWMVYAWLQRSINYTNLMFLVLGDKKYLIGPVVEVLVQMRSCCKRLQLMNLFLFLLQTFYESCCGTLKQSFDALQLKKQYFEYFEKFDCFVSNKNSCLVRVS